MGNIDNCVWVEHALGGRDSFAIRYFYDLLIWQLVTPLLLVQVIMTIVHFSVVVHRDVTHLFLDFADAVIVVLNCNWHLRILQFLYQTFGDFLAGDFDGLHGVG